MLAGYTCMNCGQPTIVEEPLAHSRTPSREGNGSTRVPRDHVGASSPIPVPVVGYGDLVVAPPTKTKQFATAVPGLYVAAWILAFLCWPLGLIAGALSRRRDETGLGPIAVALVMGAFTITAALIVHFAN